MPRAELAARLNTALSKQRGVTLSLPEVVELMDSIRAMSAIIVKLNQEALAIGVSAEALAETVLDCICLSEGEIILGRLPTEYYARWRGSDYADSTVAPTFLELLDAWRKRHGKGPMEGVQISIPGSVLYQQLEQAVSAEQPIMTPQIGE